MSPIFFSLSLAFFFGRPERQSSESHPQSPLNVRLVISLPLPRSISSVFVTFGFLVWFQRRFDSNGAHEDGYEVERHHDHFPQYEAWLLAAFPHNCIIGLISRYFRSETFHTTEE